MEATQKLTAVLDDPIYVSDPLRVAHDTENSEVPGEGRQMTKAEEMEANPERYVVFKVDYSDVSLQDILHHSFTQTAMIDKFRQRFRNLEEHEFKALRETWKEGEKGFLICEAKFDELFPKRARRTKPKSIDEMLDAVSDAEQLEKYMELLKARKAELAKK